MEFYIGHAGMGFRFLDWRKLRFAEQIRPEHRNLIVSSARLVLRDLIEGQFAAGNHKIGLRDSA